MIETIELYFNYHYIELCLRTLRVETLVVKDITLELIMLNSSVTSFRFTAYGLQHFTTSVSWTMDVIYKSGL